MAFRCEIESQPTESARMVARAAEEQGLEVPDEVPMTTTECACTSPIWYTPKG